MASFLEMLDASLFLIINTIILIIAAVACGPIMDWLAVWLGSQPAGFLPTAPIQYIFGCFYGMLLLIELLLFIFVFIVPVKKTDYMTGDDDF